MDQAYDQAIEHMIQAGKDYVAKHIPPADQKAFMRQFGDCSKTYQPFPEGSERHDALKDAMLDAEPGCTGAMFHCATSGLIEAFYNNNNK